MKKVLSFIILMLLPMMAGAYDAKVGGIYYVFNQENKTATVTYRDSTSVYNGVIYSPQYSSDYEGDVVIPDAVTWEGVSYKVKSIGNGAFRGCPNLTSISIPPSITSIGYAFDGLSAVHISDLAAWCAMDFTIGYGSRWTPTMSNNPLYYTHSLYMNGEEVTDLVIPEGVTKIGNLAFQDCFSLTSVTIPSSVTSIGSGAFNGCSQLSAVHISDLAAWCAINFDVKNYAIWYGSGTFWAFYTSNPLYYAGHLYLDGKEITDLVIPEGVTSIGQNTFCHWPALTSVTIPSSIASIGLGAFEECRQLNAVHISDVGAWCSIEFDVQHANDGIAGDTVHTNNPLYSAGHLYMDGKEITDLVIPEGVKDLGDWTFVNLKNALASVTFPSTLESVANNSFKDITSLMTVRSYIKSPFHVDCFSDNTYRNGTLYIPTGTKDLYSRFDGWRSFLKIEEMELDPTPNGECATPTIIVMNNRFKFQCATPGATFTSTLTTAEEQFTGDEVVMNSDTTTYILTVYATAPGYSQSQPAKYMFTVNKTDVNNDGAIDVADIATIINKMASGARIQ